MKRIISAGAGLLLLVLSLLPGRAHARRGKVFFPDGKWQSNFICNLGKGIPSTLPPKNPRFEFEEVCKII